MATTAAGNTSSGPPLIAAHTGCADAASDLVDVLSTVLENLGDAVYSCAFDLSQADETLAKELRLPPLIQPSPSPGAPPTVK